MSTVGYVIDRLYRTYLEPPDYQPAACALGIAIDADDITFSLADFELPEDEELVKTGAVVEIGSELIRVKGYDSLTTTITNCERGFESVAVAHAVGDRVKLSPPYPRLSVFEAVADNIIQLYPDLYTVNVVNLAAVGNVAALDDSLAVEVVSAWNGMGSTDIGGTIVDFHPAVGTRAVMFNYPAGDVWVRYRRRFGAASSEEDTLVSLGVEERWTQIVMIGAAADLFVGRDMPASHVNWVGQALAAENIPVGTRMSLAGGLRRYHADLLEAAKKEMRAEYRTQVQDRQVQVVDMGGW